MYPDFDTNRMNPVFFSIIAFFSTFAGGLLAFKFRDKLHYILSFTAGVLLGVVSFEVLPEIFELSQTTGIPSTGAMISLVAGFLFFHGLEKFVLIHHTHESDYAAHRHPETGILSALALAGHSAMDGVGIGIAFQISDATGVIVAVAVIAHDFSDGLNTVSLMLAHHNSNARSYAMLILDSLAPLIGAASTLFFKIPSSLLLLYLGFFSGFLLYIAASDILPEAHSQNRASITGRLIMCTCLGALFIFATAYFSK